MKKLILIMLAMASTVVWAANEITIVPNATVHNGAAAGDAAGFIDGAGKLDVSGMAAGSYLVFDIIMTDLDFTLAGYEFKFDYPAYLTALSTTDTEWETGWTANTPAAATYVANGLTATGAVQFLPAASDGTRTSSTVANFDGTFRVGMLWTNAADRPGATAGASAIGQIAFLWDGGATCTSTEEMIKITITASDPTLVPDADIFANDSANRVVVGSSAVTVKLGDPSAGLRADGNHDGARTPADLIIAANCSLFGKDNAVCKSAHDWSTDATYDQVFDYNCSGSVTPADLLGNARLTLGIANRTSFKNVDYYNVTSKNSTITVSFEKQVHGIMSNVVFAYDGMKLSAPTISTQAQKEGWTLIFDLGPDTLNYAVFNPSMVKTTIPTVTINYESLENGKMAVLDTMTQAADLTFMSVQPVIEDGKVVSVAKPQFKPVKVKN